MKNLIEARIIGFTLFGCKASRKKRGGYVVGTELAQDIEGKFYAVKKGLAGRRPREMVSIKDTEAQSLIKDANFVWQKDRGVSDSGMTNAFELTNR